MSTKDNHEFNLAPGCNCAPAQSPLVPLANTTESPVVETTPSPEND